MFAGNLFPSLIDIHHLSDHLMDMDDTYRFLNLPSYLPDFTSKCRFRDSDERNLFWFYEPPLMLSTGANSFTDSGLSSDILVPTLESLERFRENSASRCSRTTWTRRRCFSPLKPLSVSAKGTIRSPSWSFLRSTSGRELVQDRCRGFFHRQIQHRLSFGNSLKN